MTIIGSFVLLKDRKDFEQACGNMARDIATHLDLQLISIHMSSMPKDYPCLMQVQYSSNHLENKALSDDLLILPNEILYDVDNPPEETNVKVFATYVYVKDAQQLLTAVESSDEVNHITTDTLAETVESTYVPSPIAILLLALVNELKEVGAIKKDKLLESVKKADHWLTMMQERNAEASMLDILGRFWQYD